MTNDYLVHHGVIGQKWGVRRYQNYDGSYIHNGLRKNAQTAGKRAGKEFQNQLVQRTSQKIVNKAAKVDKKKETAKDIAKTIVKGAAITAATTALSAFMMSVSNDAISAGGKFVANKLKDVNFNDLIDMAIAKHYGVL